MAEILIKAIDANHPDSVKDRRACYKKGMPVVAFPNGHEWGTDEGPPKFYILKVLDMDVDEARDYCQPDITPINFDTYRVRKWIFPLNNLENLKVSKGRHLIEANAFKSIIRLIDGN